MLGVIFSIALLFSASPDGCSCDWQTARLLWGLPILLSSLAVLSGTVIFLRFQTSGGLVTLIGAFLASPIPHMIYTNNWTWPFIPFFVVTNASILFSPEALFLPSEMVASLTLLLAGLLEIPRVRETVRVLVRKLSARYYAFLET